MAMRGRERAETGDTEQNTELTVPWENQVLAQNLQEDVMLLCALNQNVELQTEKRWKQHSHSQLKAGCIIRSQETGC